ncbi:MAG TPA: phospholipase D-like domain-containing protein, partial [Chloroflexota bacterium]
LLRALVDLLNKVKNSQTSTYAGDRIYAALFELNDPELIPALEALGDRANLILANGSTQQPGGDENAAARQELRGKVNLYDRMVGVGHLAHNKFLIVCDADDQPQAVWTGSTNWQMTGLCTQANNGILLENAQIAGWFKAQWDLLKGAGNDFPPNLINADDQKKSVTIGDRQVTAWFTPVHGLVDLSDAETMINAAQQGILFLMFNPGPEGTLLNAIVNRSISGNPTYDPNLYIHGVLNQDPSTTAHPIVGLFHRGQYTESNLDVVLPAAIDHRFAYWDEEIKKYQYAWAMVHSKVIVIDPFGPHPVVMTGSHNLGPKASSANDDNLVIVQGDPALAQAYAVNIMAIYNQYRWRYLMSTQSATASAGQPAAAAAPAPVATTVPLGAGTAVATHAEIWSGLQDNDTWQDDYFTGAKLRELNFWMGRG